MRQIATGRMAQAVGKYSEHAPMAAVCCNACRTCVQTNALALAIGGAMAAAAGLGRVARRFVRAAA